MFKSHVHPWLLACALAAACATTSSKRDLERGERYYQLGVDYFRKGMQAPALEETLKAIEADPENAEAHNLLGLIFLKQAADELRLLEVEQCMDGQSAREQRAAADDKMRKARAEFELAVRYRERFSEALNSLAVVALHFKDYNEAIRYGKEALGNILYRQPYVAHGNVGWAYYQKGDLVHAAKELREAVFHEQEFCVGHFRLAQVYYDQKEIDGALEHLQKVMADLRCPIQEAYHLAGTSYALQRRSDDARQALRKCVTLAPKSCRARMCERDEKLLN